MVKTKKNVAKRGFRLGLCTGGGDCPGLNAVIQAVVRTAILRNGYEVLGLRDGLNGLLDDPNRVMPLNLASVEGIDERGGTILGTSNKGSPFRGDDGDEAKERIMQSWKAQGLDALIVVGGDGTQGMARHLSVEGLKVVGVPKTIDNDLVGSDLTVGYMTAVETAAGAALRLKSSADAHDRMMLLETMGRDSGHLALGTGIAASADVILLPEIPFSFEKIVDALAARRVQTGRGAALIVVAEGAHPKGGEAQFKKTATGATMLGGIANLVAAELHKRTSLDARVTALGHVQRGGAGNAQDRILAATMGTHAVDLLARGDYGKIVVSKSGKLGEITYAALKDTRRPVDLKGELVRTAEAMGICLGR